MSDSNEPADGTGPDLQPQPPAGNDQPQAAPEAPDPPAEVQDTQAPTAEQEDKPPAAEPQDAPAPTAQQEAPDPPAEVQDTPAPTAEQEDKPPAAESQDAPAPTAQQEAPDPPAEVQDTQAPTAEQEDKPPAAEPQDTPPEAPDQQASKSAAADSQGDEVPKVKPPAARKAGKPGGAPKAPQSPGRGRSAGPRPTRRKPGKPPKGPSVVIRYGLMGHIGQFRHNLQPPPARGINVVVRTDRGVELGEVVTVVSDEPDCPYITPKRLEEHIAANGPDYPFRRDGKVLRLANPQDLIDQRHLNSSAKDEQKFCAQELKEMKLDMKLVAVEHLLGGERIIFYFLAEHRVDFRELVHKLANQYHTRIEMRQVGARDEARLVGDYEHCGQECCCKQFLKGLQPVSMRMAKTQKATLDPSKISGRCGRLMCCLRYEDQCYRDLKKCLPHKNIWVKTRDQIGRVTGTQILTQLVQVQLPDGSRGLFANEDIIERNVDPPPPPPAHTPRPTRQTARKTDRGRKRQDSAPSGQQAKPAADKKTPKPQRDTKPPRERRPKPAPRPDPQPRATAETLDPGWAGLLGDGVVENDSAPTSQPAADPQASPTTPPAEEPQASPQDQATTDPPPQTPHPVPEPTQPQAQAPAEQSGEAPKPAGEKRRKRRRRRGRKSRGKQQGN